MGRWYKCTQHGPKSLPPFNGNHAQGPRIVTCKGRTCSVMCGAVCVVVASEVSGLYDMLSSSGILTSEQV